MNSIMLMLLWGSIIFLMTRMPRPPSTRDLVAVFILASLGAFSTLKLLGRVSRKHQKEIARLRAAARAADSGPRPWHHGVKGSEIKYDPAIFNGAAYVISADRRTITCATCGLTSHNLNDVAARYCGHCCVFHPQPDPDALATSVGRVDLDRRRGPA